MNPEDAPDNAGIKRGIVIAIDRHEELYYNNPRPKTTITLIGIELAISIIILLTVNEPIGIVTIVSCLVLSVSLSTALIIDSARFYRYKKLENALVKYRRAIDSTRPAELDSFLLAMGQMRVCGDDLDGNLSRAKAMIADAAAQHCQMIVLPEQLDATRDRAQPIPGTITAFLGEAARQYHIYVVAGIIERAPEGFYNAAVLLSPDGEILLKYRKINDRGFTHDFFEIGNMLGVVNTPLGTIGLDICSDNFPSSMAIGHVLARMGTQLLVSPSNWSAPKQSNSVWWLKTRGVSWLKTYSTLSKLYDISIVGVSNVGDKAGSWQDIGNSLAVGPDGKVLAMGPYGADAESLIVVPITVKPRMVRGQGWAAFLHARGYWGP